jgi:pilus assembly protein CpaB
MSAKTILTLLFLVSLAAVVILGLRALPHRANSDLTTKDEVLVAAATLPSGTLLRAKDVVWQPVSAAPQPGQIVRSVGAASKTNSELDQQAPPEIYGAALRGLVKAGEPIRRSAIAKPGDRDFLQIVLAPRARAIAIPVTTGGASTGILYPGDRVDVILTQTFKNNPSLAHRSVGETVVENLRVLAIDPPEVKPNAGSNSFGRTVTLEVTAEQAEQINVAVELGKLSLTLRSIGAADGLASVAPVAPDKAAGVKPMWAGDVSAALDDAMPSSKIIAAEQRPVEIIRGTKAVGVKLR